MVTLLITSFLLLAGITYAIYLWQRPQSGRGAEFSLPPAPPGRGLFSGEFADEPPPRELPAVKVITDEERAALVERARSGERESLNEALLTNDAALYDGVLDALADGAESDKSLLSLVSYVVRSEAGLKVNRRLAERFLEDWQARPDANTTAKALHVAALSNDAGLYQRAVETAYQLWRDRRLEGVSAEELRQLVEGEFWLLAPEVRSSGAGFVLKRRLAQLRRKTKG